MLEEAEMLGNKLVDIPSDFSVKVVLDILFLVGTIN